MATPLEDPLEVEPTSARPLVGGAMLGTASRITVALTGAATTVLVARLLGADGAGSFGIAMTVVYVLNVLTTLGVEHGIAYYVSARAWAAGAAFIVSRRVALGMGLAGACAGVAARLIVPSAFGSLTVLETALAAGALPFTLAWFYGSFVALSADHYEAYVLPPALQSTTLLILAVAFAIPFGLLGAAVAIIGSHALAALYMQAWGHRHLRRPDDPSASRRQLRRALTFGVKGYAANALQVLNYRIDAFVLSAVASTAVLGHYTVAVAVTSVLWLMPQALGDVLFPRVAALSSSTHADAEQHRAFVEAKSFRHTTLIVAGSTAAVAAGLVFLVVPVYGPDFGSSTALGLIRLPGVALLGLNASISAAVLGRGHPEYGLYTTLITTPVTMALYAILIPTLDATGAALASSLSFTVSFVLTAVFFQRATKASVLPLLVPTRSELDDYRQLVRRLLARGGAGA